MNTTTAVDLTSPEAYLNRSVASRALLGRHRVHNVIRLRHGIFLGTACGHYLRFDSIAPRSDALPCLACAVLHAAEKAR